MQSFLIAEAYRNARQMTSIANASEATNEHAALHFVTDELAVPVGQRKRTVCDILAARHIDENRFRPVVMELKSAREMKRLKEQVGGYADIMSSHWSLYQEIFSICLGRTVVLDHPIEKWIVWPSASGAEPREAELAEGGIRVVSYQEENGSFTFRVGNAP